MSFTINRLTLAGVTLVRQAILKYTPAGKPYCRFTVMVDDSWKEREKRYPLDCVLWGQQAESVAPYLTRGTKLSLDGRLTINQWTDRNGARINTPEMVVQTLLLPPAPPHRQPLQRPRPATEAPRRSAQVTRTVAPPPAHEAPPQPVVINADELPPF